MTRLTRRRFLQTSGLAATTAAFAISGTKASGSILGANDAIHIGVAGIHGRGGAHINEFSKMDGVRVTHLIDPDSSLFERRVPQIKDTTSVTPKCYQDIREALEDDDLDAVSVASCNHWHALITFWACQAGKDVYVEKPCSHNVFEGRQCVEAAKKYDCIVSHGTQSRASGGKAKLAAAARSGKYGKLLVAKGYCCKPRWSIGFKETKAPPKHLDFNIWLGPAPMQPYHENLVHYNWHWFWDTGNGDMGNQGVHEIDLCRWGVGQSLPKAVRSMGARYVDEPDHDYKDQGETPNLELSVFDYGDCLLVFETRGLVNKHDEFPFKVGVEYYTEDGVLRDGKFFPKGGGDPQSVDVEYDQPPTGNIFQNFIDCVRSRKADQLVADIETAHYSSALCHLGNISYRCGNDAPWDQIVASFGDNPQVQESLDTILANVKTALPGLDPTFQLGPELAFDPASEQFTDSPQANKLLTRDYREPFVVTKEV